MKHRRGRGAHYGCTRPSLIPNKLMTPFPEATCGTTWCTLVRTRCLSTCCQSSKTCMMLMSTRCWMGPPAAVQPLFGVKQGCPLSPLLFSIYLNDIDSVTDGAQDALAHWYPWCEKHAVCWWPFSPFQWTRGLTDHAKQAEKKSHCQHTEVRDSNSENLPPLYFGGELLLYTNSFKYLGMVCDKQIHLNTAADATLCPFTAGTFRVKEFVQKNNPSNRLHAYIWLLKSIWRHMLFRLVCMRVRIGPRLTYNKAKRWTVSFKNGCWQC